MLYFAITQEKVRDDSKENKMITLPEMLWVARGYKRIVDNTESKLAYMTFVEKTKSGEESASFLKRKATGIRWAQATVSKNNVLEEADFILNYTKYLENVPRTGFKIVDYATRYRTDNKLIRIEDPTGFVLEVPVENAISLIHEATVSFGVVQEPCVWGREGNNHVLVPVTGEVFKKTKELATVAKEDMVTFARIQVGDIVSFCADKSNPQIYLGKIKVTYNLKQQQAVTQVKHSAWWTSGYVEQPETDPVVKEAIGTDSGWRYIFVSADRIEQFLQDNDSYCSKNIKSSGKCVVIGRTTLNVNQIFEICRSLSKGSKLFDSYYLSPSDSLYPKILGIVAQRGIGRNGNRLYTNYDVVSYIFNGKTYKADEKVYE